MGQDPGLYETVFKLNKNLCTGLFSNDQLHRTMKCSLNASLFFTLIVKYSKRNIKFDYYFMNDLNFDLSLRLRHDPGAR